MNISNDLTEEDIKIFELLKKNDPSFPSLPRFIRNPNHKPKIYKDKDLQRSVTGGFLKRVQNWNNAKAQLSPA